MLSPSPLCSLLCCFYSVHWLLLFAVTARCAGAVANTTASPVAYATAQSDFHCCCRWLIVVTDFVCCCGHCHRLLHCCQHRCHCCLMFLCILTYLSCCLFAADNTHPRSKATDSKIAVLFPMALPQPLMSPPVDCCFLIVFFFFLLAVLKCSYFSLPKPALLSQHSDWATTACAAATPWSDARLAASSKAKTFGMGKSSPQTKATSHTIPEQLEALQR